MTTPDGDETGLTVAVTGPTGTFGLALMPLPQADDRVERVIGIARRPFDPAERGWTKMEYRQGDVRDPRALREAFEGADVVVHLAFLILSGAKETTRAINVEGTLNTFRAAAEAGAKRFVYASSIAAYGFHPDNPIGMTEEWVTRPADRLFYAQEKAELEHLLQQEAAGHPETALYLQKQTLTATFAAGVARITEFEGVPASELESVEFWWQTDGWCGAGAPRFNITTEHGVTYFIGCATMAAGAIATVGNAPTGTPRLRLIRAIAVRRHVRQTPLSQRGGSTASGLSRRGEEPRHSG